jgi:hypothetical protein
MTTTSEAVFMQCARDLEFVPLTATNTKINLLFPSLFGVSPVLCGIIWELLTKRGNLDGGCQPKHLLWTLFFLKCYAYESVLSQVLKSDRKTTRKWIWYLVSKIAELSNETVRCFFLFYISICLLTIEMFPFKLLMYFFNIILTDATRSFGVTGCTVILHTNVK